MELDTYKAILKTVEELYDYEYQPEIMKGVLIVGLEDDEINPSMYKDMIKCSNELLGDD